MSLSVTNLLTIVVNEVNSAPVVTVPVDQVVPELAPLAIAVAATDGDIPANVLTFGLLESPSGMTIDTATGAIAWIPTEAQGPSTNTVKVVVTDDNPVAGPNARLSVTNSFLVVVQEVNVAPELGAIEDRTVHFDVPLTIEAVATDSDLPAATLAFTLEGAPGGMTVQADGTIAWTPTEAQVGVYTVTLKVEDGGSPNLNATRTFQVTVTGEGARLSISQLAAGLVQVTTSGDAGVRYELQGSTNLTTWQRITEFSLEESSFKYIDPDSNTGKLRFYRLLLLQTAQ
jgi:hypothetical protein